MTLQIFTSYDELPASLLDTLDEWYETEILNDEAYNWIKDWSDPEYIYIQFDDEQWMSAVNLYYREILVGDKPILMGGISGVMTHPDYRGKGLAPKLINMALERGRTTWTIDHALLTCKHKMIPYYEKHGWKLLNNKIFFYQSTGKVNFNPDLVVGMSYSYQDSVFPDGDIDMKGNPW